MFTVYEASGTLGTEYPDYRVESNDRPVNWRIIRAGFKTRDEAWAWVNQKEDTKPATKQSRF